MIKLVYLGTPFYGQVSFLSHHASVVSELDVELYLCGTIFLWHLNLLWHYISMALYFCGIQLPMALYSPMVVQVPKGYILLRLYESSVTLYFSSMWHPKNNIVDKHEEV